MLKKKTFYTAILLVAVLLFGLIAVQVYWVNNAYELNDISYKDKVNTVLKKVNKYTENFTFSFYLYGRTFINNGEGILIVKADSLNNIIDTVNLFNIFPYETIADTCFYSTKTSFYESLVMTDVTMRFEYKRPESPQQTSQKIRSYDGMTAANFKSLLVDSTDIINRIKLAKLDSTLKKLLLDENITSNFAYGFRKKGITTFEYISDSSVVNELENNTFKTYIFEDIAFTSPYELCLHIYNKDNTVSKSIVIALCVSMMIVLALIMAFAYFINTVIAQKKVWEMKTDFINNMTHEFMTPVTNIALGIETLEKKYDKEVLQVIETENTHLKENINRVLQVSLLEKGSIFLDIEPIDIHEILNRVARNIAVQMDEKNGTFIFHLSAQNTIVNADETHIINLFYNIVDNAIKYCRDTSTTVTIKSRNEQNKLIIDISDNGKGMSPEIQKMIFEKFYRGQKGNQHDVKGFGLGLTYVKSIAEAHGVDINVFSIPNYGTTFTLQFKQG